MKFRVLRIIQFITIEINYFILIKQISQFQKSKINIDGECYISTINKVLQLSTVDTPQNLAGKDVYIYACKPQDISSTEPIFILSLNSTVPTGYTASSSRKIGGFHCLCADVGTIDGHTLSGYVTGDILPASIWDLLHRPKGDSEGLAYDEVSECWLSIYQLSWDGTKLVSVYNGVIADGTSTKNGMVKLLLNN